MKDTSKHQGLRNQLANVLKKKGITNENVLNAVKKIPRHLFIDSSFADHAYQDKAFPIAAEQTISQPYTVAFQSQTLAVSPGDSVLEIGTGSGYQTAVLLELGAGFAFVSQQYNLEIGNNDYYIDLLFYHTRLHCYVAIELKTGAFKPEYVGKMNFYLSALDDTMKTASDNPSIGLILCRTKDKITAEYALRGMSQPIGVSDYQLKALPSPEELQKILNK